MFSFSSFFDLTVPPQPVVNSSDLVNCTIAPDTITLQCFWSTASYYVAWYKDGVLISNEDLANNTTLMSPSVGTVSSSFDDRMSVLTIMNSSFNDSGNYTCAVSCGARGVEFDNITSTLLDTIQVLVFGECHWSVLEVAEDLTLLCSAHMCSVPLLLYTSSPC